jgi:hypothetical protein
MQRNKTQVQALMRKIRHRPTSQGDNRWCTSTQSSTTRPGGSGEPIFNRFSTSLEPAKDQDQEPIHVYRLINFGDEREADTDLNLVLGRHMNFALPGIEGDDGAFIW